jgi:hypothetical protein
MHLQNWLHEFQSSCAATRTHGPARTMTAAPVCGTCLHECNSLANGFNFSQFQFWWCVLALFQCLQSGQLERELQVPCIQHFIPCCFSVVPLHLEDFDRVGFPRTDGTRGGRALAHFDALRTLAQLVAVPLVPHDHGWKVRVLFVRRQHFQFFGGG